MKMLPAIDLLGGQAVRLTQGDYQRKEAYGDPLALAASYEQHGASYVHVVDLDAAKSGVTDQQTRDIVARIVKETSLQVELGGGIRTGLDVERWLSLGVWRCVLGTSAVRVEGFAQEMVKKYKQHVIVGIDTRQGFVATNGWTQVATMTAIDFAKILAQDGYTECIYTDIARDGMMHGANWQGAVELAEASGLGVAVSGGVRDIRDVGQALSLSQRGITGLIAGKSLVEGTLDLHEAITLMAEKSDSP